MGLISWLVVGAIAGYLAGLLIKGPCRSNKGTAARASLGDEAINGSLAIAREPCLAVARQPIGSGLPRTGQRKSAAASRTRLTCPLATSDSSCDQLVTRVEPSPDSHVA